MNSTVGRTRTVVKCEPKLTKQGSPRTNGVPKNEPGSVEDC
jgi:hypothetical protein